MQKTTLSVMLLAFVCAASVHCNPTTVFANANMQKSLMNYLMTPNVASNANVDPAVTAECFDKYLPMLTTIADTFSTTYKACITLANNETTALNAQAAQNRSTYTDETSEICTAYQKCNSENAVLDFFNCYATESSQDVSQLYVLATNATNAATTLSQGLQHILDDQDICTKACENNYVSDTAQTYDDLDNCLANGLSAVVTTDEPAVTQPVVTQPAVTTPAAAAGSTVAP